MTTNIKCLVYLACFVRVIWFVLVTMFASIGRITTGFIAQCLGVLVSVKVFATSGGTIFWWTHSAITISAMLHVPDTCWPERVAHVATGMAAYVCFRYKKFSVPLLAAVCASNGLGQAFGYCLIRRFYPELTPKAVCTLRFLGVFLLFPVILASLVASIPGSLGFWFFGEDVDLYSVFLNYSLGHISGTAALLYPLLVVPAQWRERPGSHMWLVHGAAVFLVVAFLFSFMDYHLFGFATIVVVYALFVGISAYTDQCCASLIQLACTCSILGLTASGRGPFVYVIAGGGAEAVLIGTQMGMTMLTALSAFVVILVSQLRALETFERNCRRDAEEMGERQTLDLFRIGHDMKNNFTLIQAICEQKSDELADETLRIVQSINVLNDLLISDMVEMVNGSKAESRPVLKEGVDVVEVMKIYLVVAGGLLMLEGKETSVVARLECSGIESDGTAVAHTNRERLHQLVSNLVNNAVKYTESGEIVLRVDGSSESGGILIDVSDTGIGLSSVDVSRVFDLFYRSKRASEVNSGAGLGLANVRKICSTIGAKIRVSSPGEGQGSTFSLILPRNVGVGQDPGTSKDATISAVQFSLRVLVMDDSLVIRKLMTKYLASFGCEVVDTSSAEESRDLVSRDERGFDMVITDSSMAGGESGPDFIKSIRRGQVGGLPPSLPCILCSGERQFIFDDAAADTKTLAITKPFSSNDIASALKVLVARQEDDVL